MFHQLWPFVKMFSQLMNMTEPINMKTYNVINDHLLEAYLVAADNSMSQAATEVKKSVKNKKITEHFISRRR